MRFGFYLEDYGRDFSLSGLLSGELRTGGQAARLRQLFWLAKRGHDVLLFNHHDGRTWDGVRGVLVRDPDDLAHAVAGAGGLDLFVFNNQSAAKGLVDLSLPTASAKAMWAGNSFPASWLEWLDDERLSRIVCVSHWHREFFRPYRGFERLEMSYSGVDLDLLARTPTVPREEGLVVFIGAPRVTKGFHNVLRAWPHVRRRRPHARLCVVGGADLHDPRAAVGWTGVLDAELEATFLDPLVGRDRDLTGAGLELAGSLGVRAVFRELRRATVAVVNCNWEGSLETYCRSAVEAQGAGVPVVGAARGSLPEVVRHRETGILVDEPDPRALAEAIDELLGDPALRARFSAAGTRWAPSIGDYGTIAADWEGIAARAIGRHRAPAPSRRGGDWLRHLGYGRGRLLARRLLRGVAK